MDNITPLDDENKIITLSGMYEDYFLDYSSYVILERAVPSIIDGLKPVQRRIFHAMKNTDDGRFHKVANIIGNTMQFHPHGDAAIGDALVNLGQKNLMIDCQGNWGDVRTGDGAAASRYIEARLTKFALEVAFNPQITQWQLSYDGRKKEPIDLPMKFPLLLAQGVEGIAVGLSTKIMPHNFIELIQASIKILKGKPYEIYPDFQTGGYVNVADYNEGARGGKIKVRAKMHIEDKKFIKITELPYATTTQQVIDSILKANDKGKIKVKKVIDNTAENVEILIELASGVSPELMIDALYAFTNCEISISPNACIIVDDKPRFWSVNKILEISTANTKEYLRRELEIKKSELLEKWLFANLEKIFIENRVYHHIEECETWEAVLEVIEVQMAKYIRQPHEPKDQRLGINRILTIDDYTRLTEIRIKRISKFNAFKANELISNLEAELKEVNFNLANLIDFAVNYFQNLLEKYGKGRERKTKIQSFDTIQATQVVANNAKLYINRSEGFIGTGLKKDEFICECSDIDDIIVFRKNGEFSVSRVTDKNFVGKNIIHAAVWKKGDERTTYNVVYVDGETGRAMAKRFQVKAITREKTYPFIAESKGSRLEYFTQNPNGESEILNVQLTQGCSAKKKVFEFDFAEIAIKGRASKGNIVTRYPLRKISLKEKGKSTLGATTIWVDEVTGRLNKEKRGVLLGEFDTGDHIICIYKNGTYEMMNFDLPKKLDLENLIIYKKLETEDVFSTIYYDGNKSLTYAKRFKIETSSLGQKFSFITEHAQSKLNFISTESEVQVSYKMRVKGKYLNGEINLNDFIDVKGWKAIGNKLSEHKISSVELIDTKTDSEEGEE